MQVPDRGWTHEPTPNQLITFGKWDLERKVVDQVVEISFFSNLKTEKSSHRFSLNRDASTIMNIWPGAGMAVPPG